MNHFKQQLKHLPIGTCGTVLALITLGSCWNLKDVTFFKPLAVLLAMIVVGLQFTKGVLHPDQIKEDLKNPITGSLYPTLDMAIFLIADFIFDYIPVLGQGLWLFGIVLHLCILITFVYHRKKMRFEEIVPSWFVLMVGIIVACVASPGMGFDSLARGIFIFGCTSYILMWPVMFYKVITKKLTQPQSFTTGILAAPASLAIVGYMTVFKEYNTLLLGVLFITSIINLLIVYLQIPKLLKQDFQPGFGCYTFPLAISVLAMYKMSAYHSVFGIIADLELFVSTGMICFIGYKFATNFVGQLRLKSN